MKKDIEYSKAPDDVEQSLDRAVVVPNFSLIPKDVVEFARVRAKKQVNIYLSVDTIEKFKKAAKENGGRYQTMISDVLDTYTQRHL